MFFLLFIFSLIPKFLQATTAIKCEPEDLYKPICLHLHHRKNDIFDLEKHIVSELSFKYPLAQDYNGNPMIYLPMTQEVIQEAFPTIRLILWKYGYPLTFGAQLQHKRGGHMLSMCKSHGCGNQEFPTPVPVAAPTPEQQAPTVPKPQNSQPPTPEEVIPEQTTQPKPA